MKSIQSIRTCTRTCTLRTASSAPPPPPKHRQFSSRPATSSRSSLLGSIQSTRPRQGRQSSLCPSCQHRLPVRRNFSLASFASTTVDITEATILQLHHVTHTPWYITIPLVALSINLLFRLPLSVHARNLTHKRAQLNPLLRSWTNLHTEQVLKERQRLRSEQLKRLASTTASSTGNTGNEEAPVDVSVASVQAEVLKRHVKTSGRIYAKFGVQQWKLYANILALPPWLVVIEAIRRMCGAPVGLLGMIFRKTPAADSAQTAAVVADAAAASPASVELVDTAAAAAAAATTDAISVSVLSEPSLATGGCLWFPDLTATDPYHILPFALSAMLVVNILPSSDAGRRMLFGLPSEDGSLIPQSAMSRGIQRSLLIMSFSVGFVTMNFPAAIHLYWLSSAGTTYAITRALRYLKPMPNDPPLRQHREGPWIIPRAPAAAEQ